MSSVQQILLCGGASTDDPYWSDVKLLLHGEGTDGGTTFTDSGPLALSPVSAETSTTSTTQFKYGSASIRCPATSTLKHLHYASGSQWDIGAADFTIEMFVWEDASGSSGSLLCRRQPGTSLGWVYTRNGLRAKINGSWSDTQMTWSAPSTAAWHHHALVLDGTTLRAYIDGVQVATKTSVTSIDNPASQDLTLGTADGNNENRLKGYIDELRFTNGTCRYPSGTTFTPPAAAFPNS